MRKTKLSERIISILLICAMLVCGLDVFAGGLNVKDADATELPTEYVLTQGDMVLHALVSAQAKLPENAEFEAAALDEESDAYADAYKAAFEQLALAEELSFTPYELYFEADGERVELKPEEVMVYAEASFEEEGETSTMLVGINTDGKAEVLPLAQTDLGLTVEAEYPSLFDLAYISTVGVTQSPAAPAEEAAEAPAEEAPAADEPEEPSPAADIPAGGTVYVLLYENGDLVFQQTEEPDETRGELTDTYLLDTSEQYKIDTIPWYPTRSGVKKVIFADTVKPICMDYWFYYMKSLTEIEWNGNLDASALISMVYTFAESSALSALDLSGWETTSLENLNHTFYKCTGLESIDFTGWETPSLTNLSYTFYQLQNRSMNTLDLSDWDMSHVTTMAYAFYESYYLTELDTSKWVLSSVTSLTYAFKGCRDLVELEAGTWDLSNLANMSYAFSFPNVGANSDTTAIHGTENWNLESLTNMSYAFYNDHLLTDIDVSTWKTPLLNNMSYAFYGCKALTELDVSGWDVSSVTNMSYAFYNCYAALDLSGWNTEKVTGTGMTKMFYNGPGRLKLGESFRFRGTTAFDDNSAWQNLETGAAYSHEELCSLYNENAAEMAGTYVRTMGPGAIGYVLRYQEEDGESLIFRASANLIEGKEGLIEIYTVDTSKAYSLNTSLLTPWYNIRTSITKIVFEDRFIPVCMDYWFYGMNKLTSLEKLENLDTSHVTSMTDLFRSCSKLTSIDMSTWDLSQVKSMDRAFRECSSLTSLGRFRVGLSSISGAGLQYAFYGCSKLTNLDVSNWDLSGVTSLSYTFYGCSSLTSLDAGNWNLTAATNMSYAFNGCTSLLYLNTAGWDLSGVTNFSYAFNNCSSLTMLDTRSWHLSAVTNMQYAFYNCRSLLRLDAADWDLSNVTGANMNYAFSDCKSLTGIETSNWGINGVTQLQYVFSGCSSLVTLDLSNWDVSNVVQINGLFRDCASLETMDLSRWNVKNLTNLSYAFQNCSALTDLNLTGWESMPVENLTYTFAGCSSMTGFDIGDWNVSNVKQTYLTYTFTGCSSLTDLDLSRWNISQITSLEETFSYCSSLRSVTFGNGWDFSKVTVLRRTFEGCSSLTALDLNDWNTSAVTTFAYMFKDCENLSDLKISQWNTEKVTIMTGMFSGCTSLTVLDVSGWNPVNVTAVANAPTGDSALQEIILGPNSLKSSRYSDYFDMGGSSALWVEKGTDNVLTKTKILENHRTQASNGSNTEIRTYYKVRTITFNANGGYAMPGAIDYWWPGHAIKIPTAVRRGADFGGWWTELLGGEELTDGEAPMQDTYYAHWIEHKYTLILSSNDPSNSTVETVLEFNEIYHLSGDIFERRNYVITGWNTLATPTEDNPGTEYHANEEILQLSEHDGDTVYLFAQWTYSTDVVTVTFDTLGGTTLPSWDMERGDVLGPLPTPTLDGFTFGGWYVAGDDGLPSGSEVTSRTRIWDNVTLVALWHANPRIIFDYNIGDQTATEERTVIYGHAVGQLPVDRFAGRYGALVGWFTQPEGGEQITALTTVTEDGTTFYAHWGWKPRFNANGGKITSSPDYPIQEGADNYLYTITEFPEVEHDGYLLIGWFLPDGETEVKLGDKVNLFENSEIIAHWDRNDTVFITLMPDGGTLTDLSGNKTTDNIIYEVFSGETVDELPIPTRTGYEFLGWEDLNGEIEGYCDGRTIFTKHSVLIARWKQKDCTVTFDLNDDDGDDEHSASFYNSTLKTKTETVARGDSINTIPGCNRSTYTLEGWYTSPDGTGEKLTTDTVINGNVTYYAHWVKFHTTKTDNLHEYTYGVEWGNASNSNVDNCGYSLEFHPTNNARQTAQLHISFELNNAYGATKVLPAGTVYFRVPKNIFFDKDGNPVDSNNIETWLSEYPTVGEQLFSYVDMGDYYYLVNNRPIDTTGFTMTIEYSVTPNELEGGAMNADGVKNGIAGGDGRYVYSGTDEKGKDTEYKFYEHDFQIEFGIDEGNPVNVAENRYPWDDPQSKETKDLHLEMHTKVETTAKKEFSSVAYRWNNSWGPTPDDADDYFYVVWRLTDTYATSTNQSSTYLWSEDNTVHDGTVVYMSEPSGSHDGDGLNTRNKHNEKECTVVTKHSRELLSHIPTTGLVIHNEAIVTETWASGYVTQHRVSAETKLFSDGFTFGEFEKNRYLPGNTSANPRVKNGGQEDIIFEDKEIYMPWELIYEGSANSALPIWNEETNTYYLPNRTIRMLDGVYPGSEKDKYGDDRFDLMYSSGRSSSPYIWEPETGNVVLNDDDYHFTALTFTLTEYDSMRFGGMDGAEEIWTTPQSVTDTDQYQPIEVYIRRRNSTEFEPYATINYSSSTRVLELPDDTVGFEIRHASSYYKTYLYVKADMYLIPTQKITSLVQNDVDAKTTSIFKNRATCDIWTTEKGEGSTFFQADSKEEGFDSALNDLYELNVSSTAQRTTKATGSYDDEHIIVDSVNGVQYAPMAISGYNTNNSGRKKYLRTGVFYDLLPAGTTVNTETIICLTGGVASVDMANSYAEAFRAAWETDPVNPVISGYANRLDTDFYDIRFMENWEGSGRTMMIISLVTPEGISAEGFTVLYMLQNPNSNIKSNGTTLENDVAFANISQGRLWPDSLEGDISSLKEDQKFYESLAEEHYGFISFAQTSVNFKDPAAFSWSFNKMVDTGRGYKVSDSTLLGKLYTYRLSYSQSSTTNSKNVVLYEILEQAARRRDDKGRPTERLDSQWQGTFESFDVEFKFEKEHEKFAYTLYYSVMPRDKFNLEEVTDPANGGEQCNLNGEFWTVITREELNALSDDEKAQITAIAVDFSKGSDDKALTLSGELYLDIFITMRAPKEVKGDSLQNGQRLTAYNEGVIYAQQSSSNSQSGETTPLYSDAQVTLRDVNPKPDKTSDLGTGTEKEPIVVEQNQLVTYQISVTNTEEDLTLEDIIVKDVIPDGMNIMFDDILVHFGDRSQAILLKFSTRAKATRGRDAGNNMTQELIFTISTLLPGETIYFEVPVQVTVTNKIFENRAEITEVEGITKSIKTDSTWHQAQPSTEIILEPKKVVENRNAPTGLGEFNFQAQLIAEGDDTVSDGKVYNGITVNSFGEVEIGPIKYRKDAIGKTFTYRITEIEGTDPFIEYSKEEFYARVTVSAYAEDADGNRKSGPVDWDNDEYVYLETQISYYADEECTEELDDAVFTNTYTRHGAAELSIQKLITTLNEVDYVIEEGDFTFTAVEIDQTTLEPLSDATVYTGTALPDGRVTFDRIDYTPEDNGKSFLYLIQEDGGDIPGIGYSSEKVYAMVTVTEKIVDDENDDTFDPEITYFTVPPDGTWDDRVPFIEPSITNDYYHVYEPETGWLRLNKILDDEAPDEAAEQEFRFVITGPETAAGATCMVEGAKEEQVVFPDQAPYTVTVTVVGEGTLILMDLPPGTYAVAEDPESAEIEGFAHALTMDPADGIVKVRDSRTVTVTATNTYREKGNLSLDISKTVTGNLGDRSKAFKFSITLTDKDGVPVSGEFPVETLGEWEAPPGDSISFDEQGKATVWLSNGQRIIISELPAGTHYEIEEANGVYAATVGTNGEEAVSGNLTEGDLITDTTVDYTNSLNLTVPTNATTTFGAMLALTALMILVGGMIAVGRRRRRRR